MNNSFIHVLQVETWALLCGAVQTLQDKVLQAQGVFANLCNFDMLLITPEKLLLTAEGNIEIDTSGMCHDSDKYVHPELSMAKIRSTQVMEKLAITTGWKSSILGYMSSGEMVPLVITTLWNLSEYR